LRSDCLSNICIFCFCFVEASGRQSRGSPLYPALLLLSLTINCRKLVTSLQS
jgi:hypothetical protein